MIFTEGIRKRIDEIDSEISVLFEERMSLAKMAGEYKIENGLPVYDKKREKEILERNSQYVSEDIRSLYSEFTEKMLYLSKKYQYSVLSVPDNITVFTENGYYPVIFGRLNKLPAAFNTERKCLIVTDSNIPEEYIKSLEKQCAFPVTVKIEAGEKSKNKDTLFMLLNAMLNNSFDRTDCVIALGGGVTGDIAGLSASLYMRGIDFYNIPTSLLSMVDSSVGGKTAINFGNVKNSIGTFYPPKAVLIDTSLLKTLPEREYSNGMAEIIKTAALFDEEMFSYLESNDIKTVKNNVSEIVKKCIQHKKYIAQEDEHEKGIRKVLNFGHTLGHAIEICDSSLLHGECVALGMLFFSENEAHERLLNLLKKYSLIKETSAKEEEICERLRHDKKVSGDKISIVRVKEIGSFTIESTDIQSVIEKILK